LSVAEDRQFKLAEVFRVRNDGDFDDYVAGR
jgi:hypothetical protein